MLIQSRSSYPRLSNTDEVSPVYPISTRRPKWVINNSGAQSDRIAGQISAACNGSVEKKKLAHQGESSNLAGKLTDIIDTLSDVMAAFVLFNRCLRARLGAICAGNVLRKRLNSQSYLPWWLFKT